MGWALSQWQEPLVQVPLLLLLVDLVLEDLADNNLAAHQVNMLCLQELAHRLVLILLLAPGMVKVSRVDRSTVEQRKLLSHQPVMARLQPAHRTGPRPTTAQITVVEWMEAPTPSLSSLPDLGACP